jgi:drug/metabolite transporter (DMT)-like permease
MTLIQGSTSERIGISGRTLGGVAAGTFGIIVLTGPAAVFSGTPVHHVGAAVLILGAISWAIGSEIARRVPRPSSFLMANACYLLTGGVLLLVSAVVVGEGGRLEAVTVSTRSVVALCYLTVFGTIVAFVAYTWLLDNTSLAAVSTYAFVNPIVAVILGWALGGEVVNARVIIATALVITAVALILSERRSASFPSGMSNAVQSSRVDRASSPEMAGGGTR